MNKLTNFVGTITLGCILFILLNFIEGYQSVSTKESKHSSYDI